MKRNASGWAVLGLLVACGSTMDVVDHSVGAGDEGAEGTQSDGAQSDGAQADGTDEADPPELRDGNFPEPAIPICGDLPDGVDAISDLVSAWVVTGERPSYPEDTPGPTTPRLRLGSLLFAADEHAADLASNDCGPDGWMIAFDLPEPLVPGVVQIDGLLGSYIEVFHASDGGCIGGGGLITADPTEPIVGQLEVIAVTDACVIGRFHDAHSQLASIPQITNGGFVAQRAVLPCVPLEGLDCE